MATRQPKDGRTKKKLLATLARFEDILYIAQRESITRKALLQERDELVAKQQRQLADVNALLDNRCDQLIRKSVEVQSLRENLRLTAEELVVANAARKMMADQFHKQVAGREREQVLLKAMMTTLVTLPIHEAVEEVRRYAQEAEVSEEVALDVFDKYFRLTIFEKAVGEENDSHSCLGAIQNDVTDLLAPTLMSD